MGLFDIVQYEVQVFAGGYWHVRVRYPRSDRDDAFKEARRLDLTEGLSTRVVRDVYDPRSGRNQEITIFVSDRAKAIGPRPAPRDALRDPARAPSRRRAGKQPYANHNERPAPLAFRATMALGVGLVTALLITAIASWALTPTQESFASVLARTPAPGASTTLFVAVMLFSVFTMLRGPLGISRLARMLIGPEDAVSTHETGRTAVPSKPRAEPREDHDTHVMNLSRTMLARFFIEAAPANVARAMEDDLGRRGLALYLAGAASAMASRLEIPSPGDLLNQIAPAALQAAAKEALADARALDPADAQLMAAGRGGVQKYMETPEERPSMAGALVAWHKLVKAEAPEVQPPRHMP